MRIKFIILLSFLIFLSGCGKIELIGKKDIIGYVNKEPIQEFELRRDIALRSRQDPSFKVTPETERDQLDMIINKKIIVQGAMAAGLAREERFVNTIKNFWEQTLIRDFIDFKKKEFQEYLFVTGDEVNKYYENLKERVTFKVLKSRDKRQIDDAYNVAVSNKDAETLLWETVGPIAYDEVASRVLLEAFGMAVGEVKKVEDAPNYYVIMVAERQPVELEPLEKLRPEIEKRILAMKERRLFDDWLKQERNKAKIRILK